MRYFYDVSGLLFSFAVFAVIPLLLAAVFRCYFAAAGFKKPEFLRPSEVLPLYFSGIISGISDRATGDPTRRAVGCAPRPPQECAASADASSKKRAVISVSAGTRI